MTASSIGAHRSRLWVGVLGLAVLQVVAPAVTFVGFGASPGAGGADLLITPAGWAFAIWGPIYALAVAQAVGVLAASRRGGAVLPRRLALDLATLYLAGAVWIVVAAAEISWATAVVLVVMAAAGVDGALTAVRSPVEPAWLRRLTLAAVGLYAGWVTAAVFLNLSTAAVEAGWVDADAVGWQLGVLVLAGLTVLGLTIALRGTTTYALAGGWAFVGIAVTTSGDGQTALLVTALAGVVLVAAAAVVAGRTADTMTASGPRSSAG